MTICHQPNDEGEYTDEQYVSHLMHSSCSECSNAGFRFAALIEENKKLKQAQGVRIND
jgi:hypothetical protein